MEYWAHVKLDEQGNPVPHLLLHHQDAVGRLASEFALLPQSKTWAQLSGLWHDLGKYQAEFQAYIRRANGLDAHIETTPGRVKHAIAGAIHATQALPKGYGQLLAYLIAGHHAGLPDWQTEVAHGASGAPLANELAQETATLEKVKANGALPDLLNPGLTLPPPPISRPEELHFWLRMQFSCLVDGDFLDTEVFYNPEQSSQRGNYPTLVQLGQAYGDYMACHFPKAEGSVNHHRAQILEACLTGAQKAPGLFTLSVPTGGGKTLASLGFALHHARLHDLKRVIYVIPYTSIIEQTADVFRRVFRALEPSPVIEHHSNLEAEHETVASRLACENWDAPIVVTTNVQFFESLYAAKTSRCRKLHNIAESVVILDETQLLPPEHLAPILDALRQLTARYKTTVVLSTATQPALAHPRLDPFGRVLLQGLGQAHELAPDPAALHHALKRVNVTLPKLSDVRRDWPGLAAELAQLPQVLCIVNRRNDAEALWRLLPKDEANLHLSARMCGAHRAQVIEQIRQRLIAGLPTRVISTQLVEAGVDLDFPVVYRAMAGLDSIAQAAGRCNREGKLASPGKVVVFHPPKASPTGLLIMAEQAAENVLSSSSPDESLTPANFTRYFDEFYAVQHGYDKGGVMDLLTRDATKAQIQFRTAAERFRLIEDDGQRQVFVQWGQGQALIDELKASGPNRDLMRRLQRYTVSLQERQWKALLASNDLALHLDFLTQSSSVLYHEQLGLLPEVPDYHPSDLMES